MKKCLQPLMVAVLTFASTGCAITESEPWIQTMQAFRPRPHDGPLELDEDEDPWGFVGDEGRADRDRERDPDRWWHNLVMSQEARNIERNLGID